MGFDQNATNPVQSQITGITAKGVVEYAGQNGYGTVATHPNADKFSPRIGFAWNVMPERPSEDDLARSEPLVKRPRAIVLPRIGGALLSAPVFFYVFRALVS